METQEQATYRQRLLEMRERLVRSVENLKSDVQQAVAAPGDGSKVPTHIGDNDSEGLDNYIVMADAEDHLLTQVDEALGRIERGEYGNCAQCEEPIAAARLEALPYTSYCVTCAAKVEQETADED